MGDLVLYYYDLSMYSQIVRTGFAEKNLSYKKKSVDLVDMENLEPAFVKLNPKCKVPVLVHGENITTESLEILKYLDETFPDSKRMCPDPESAEGELCSMYKEMADYFDILKLIIHVPWYPDVSETTDTSVERKKAMAQALWKIHREDIPKRCDKYAEEHEDLKDAYMEKKALSEKLPEEPDCEELKEFLVHFDDVMVKLEIELERVEGQYKEKQEQEEEEAKEAEEGEEEGKESKKEPEKKDPPKWLCGENYTVADLYWSVILYRLDEAGLAGRFWADGKRPQIAAYYERTKCREGFKKALPAWSTLFFQALKYRCTIL